MRYRIETMPLLGQHLVIVTAWPDGKPDHKVHLHTIQIDIADLKVDDLQHLLYEIWAEVAQVTP